MRKCGKCVKQNVCRFFDVTLMDEECGYYLGTDSLQPTQPDALAILNRFVEALDEEAADCNDYARNVLHGEGQQAADLYQRAGIFLSIAKAGKAALRQKGV
jgi:hypothetical protein